MLSSYETEFWKPRNRSFPEIPLNEDGVFDLAYIIQDACDFVSAFVPFNYANNIYRAKYAEELMGNCYAQAEAVASLLNAWGIENNYIFLDNNHASNVVFSPEDNLVYYFDARGLSNAVDISEREQRLSDFNGSETVLHGEFLKYASTNNSANGSYFWVEDDIVYYRPIVCNIREVSGLENKENAHIIISAKEGIEMLHAIGDLKRYKTQDPERYEKMWEELIDLIPSFFGDEVVPKPSVVAIPVL